MKPFGLYIEIPIRSMKYIPNIHAASSTLEWIGDGSGRGRWDVSLNGSEAACMAAAKRIERLRIPGLVMYVYRIQTKPRYEHVKVYVYNERHQRRKRSPRRDW